MNTKKTIYQYDKEGNFIKEWSSRTEAANFYGFNLSNITRIIQVQHGYTKEYQWRDFKVKNIGKSKYRSNRRILNTDCLLKLKKFREQKGYTQKDIAKELKMTPAYYNTIERHGKIPHLLYIYDLMKILDIKFEDLFENNLTKTK